MSVGKGYPFVYIKFYRMLLEGTKMQKLMYLLAMLVTGAALDAYHFLKVSHMGYETLVFIYMPIYFAANLFLLNKLLKLDIETCIDYGLGKPNLPWFSVARVLPTVFLSVFYSQGVIPLFTLVVLGLAVSDLLYLNVLKQRGVCSSDAE